MLHDKKRQVVLRPEDATARYELGEALFLDGQLEGATKQLEKALELEPEHAAARNLLARAYRKDGRNVPAERLLVAAVRAAPDDVGARDELAAVLADVGRVDDAIVHLEEAARRDPADATRHIRLADLAERRRLYDRALGHLEAARRLAPDDDAVARALSGLRLLQGDALGAGLSPLERGDEFLRGRTRAALASREVAPLVAAAPLAAVATRLRAGDVAGAKRALVTVPAASTESLGYLLLRGELRLLAGDRARARDDFARLCERSPGLVLAARRQAELEAAQGDHRAAAACWRRVVAALPGDPEANEGLGDALARLGDSDGARAAYEEALSRRPDPILDAKARGLRPGAARPDDVALGVVGALGWDAFGGIVSRVEAVAIPGKGELVFTGNVVGRSGREAAQVAWSCLKARAAALRIEEAVATNDLHVHFVDTENAKDGPSAGLALTLAGWSALTKRPLARGLAASGEITLQGAVRPVGGLHEKLVAAYLAGIELVILPRKNLIDARSVPEEVLARLRAVYVDSLAEALEHAPQR